MNSVRRVSSSHLDQAFIEDRNPKFGKKIKFCNRLLNMQKKMMRWKSKICYCGTGKSIPLITEEILGFSAIEIARQIREKEISSEFVVHAYIERVKEVNAVLKCMVEDRFEDALDEAREVDTIVARSDPQSLEINKPFLGVPFTTKDSIAVKDIHQTCGTWLRMNTVATEDAEVIERIRSAGAIIIGVTNVPELCMWWETYNHVFGRTRNPYNTNRVAGGSSGGEACIQAVGGSCFGIGADMGGSIRIPAFFCGVFGHKPSKNIVPFRGHYPPPANPMHELCFAIGPMAKCAEDLRPLLAVMAGPEKDKLKLDEPVDLKNLKVYYQFRNDAPLVDPVDPDLIQAMANVVNYLENQHNMYTEEKDIKWIRRTVPIWMTLMKDEKKLCSMLMKRCSRCKIIWEIVKSVFGCSKNTIVALVGSHLDYGGIKFKSPEYNQILEERADLEIFFKHFLGDDGVFLFPTHPTVAPYHKEPIFKAMNFSYTALINCLGFPATNVPLGMGRDNLPLGIQIVANHNNDRFCLTLAEILEEAFGGWIEPQSKTLKSKTSKLPMRGDC